MSTEKQERNPGKGQNYFYALMIDNPQFPKEKIRQNRGSQSHKLMPMIHKQNGTKIYINFRKTHGKSKQK